MKTRYLMWGIVLASSHAAAYLSMVEGARQLADGTTEAFPLGGPPYAKSRERGERTGMSSCKALLDEILASDLSNKDFQAAYEALCVDWIKRDLGGVLDLFFLPESASRYWDMASDSKLVSEELDKGIARQPEMVWHWMQSGRYGSKRTALARMWSSALLDDGQRELVFAHLHELGLEARRYAAIRLCQRSNAAELDRIRRLFSGSFMEHRDMGDLLDIYRGRRISLAEGDGTKVLEGEEDTEFRRDLTRAWVEKELSGLPADQIANRLAAFPEDVLSHALWNLRPDSRGEGLAGLVDLVGEVSRAGLWERVGEVETAHVADLFTMLAYDDYEDPGELVAYLQGISDPVPRAAAMRRVGHLWSIDNEVALKRIIAMPEGADREELLVGYVRNAPGEQVGLEEALSQIRDAERREKIDQARREWRQRLDEGGIRPAGGEEDGNAEEDPFKDSAE